MIGADTNIVARAIFEDDPKQTSISQQFLEAHTEKGDLYLSPFMILELAWLLKTKGRVRKEISEILDKLIHARGVTVGQKNVVVAALGHYSKGRSSFADYLIVADAEIGANAKTATFDEDLIRSNVGCVKPN